MSVHKTTKNGKPAWQWGEHGAKYTGTDARGKAEKQGKATYAHGYMGKSKK